jgi:UDP-N-acetylmuramate: L-alanyl-gamma-D-glutamyl-meso-diaminopimelate ligase
MKVHFIAIGGSVMHQLAIALKRKGYTVSGSDDEIFEPANSNLRQEGILPASEGWDPKKITTDLDAVILGMHAKADNPELARATELGLKIYSFPEYIYQESLKKQRIAVGGSHGKTTTTSMIMHVLRKMNRSFDYLVGAKLEGFSQSVQITDAPVIVCEADEYPASTLEKRPKFHFLFPHVAILTGIAWDHINVFPTFDFYLEQFSIFISMIAPGGVLICNETDSELNKLVEQTRREDIRYIPYSIPAHTIRDGITSLELEFSSGPLSVFGDHNLLNLNAAYLVCKELGVTVDQFIGSIADFKGASKRLEVLAVGNDSIVFRDFAHAPSKLNATIDAVRQQFPERKLVAVFELHTFSSLNSKFMNEYAGSMDKADDAVVFYSSHALELKRLPPLAAEQVKEGFKRSSLEVMTDSNTLKEWLLSKNQPGTCFLLMSSGNYDGLDVQSVSNELTGALV